MEEGTLSARDVDRITRSSDKRDQASRANAYRPTRPTAGGAWRALQRLGRRAARTKDAAWKRGGGGKALTTVSATSTSTAIARQLAVKEQMSSPRRVDWATGEDLPSAPHEGGYFVRLRDRVKRGPSRSARRAGRPGTRTNTSAQQISPPGQRSRGHNSPLSEAACLAPNTGFSLRNRGAGLCGSALGDFATAPSHIDQLSAGEPVAAHVGSGHAAAHGSGAGAGA